MVLHTLSFADIEHTHLGKGIKREITKLEGKIRELTNILDNVKL